MKLTIGARYKSKVQGSVAKLLKIENDSVGYEIIEHDFEYFVGSSGWMSKDKFIERAIPLDNKFQCKLLENFRV